MIDLLDPRIQRVHPRTDSRIFTAAERDLIESPRDRWRLWACKEAAYKALSRLKPGLAFIPIEFEVRPAHVQWGGQEVPYFYSATPEHVHVWTAGTRSEMCHRIGDAHEAVRKLAAKRIYPSDPSRVTFRSDDRIPWAYLDGERLNMPLTFSHHGRFIAFGFSTSGSICPPIPSVMNPGS